MKERVEIQKMYSVADCLDNPNKYYVFGDNLIRKGHGGQAIIRSCPNAIGIPTKRLPSMDEDAFFSDQPDEIQAVQKFLTRLILFYNRPEQPIIVFPADGLGTGLAQLKERSPKIYEMIGESLQAAFDVDIQP